MILKRYVKVENGMVYDTDNKEQPFDIIGGNIYPKYISLQKLPPQGKITATADEIWELVENNWLCNMDNNIYNMNDIKTTMYTKEYQQYATALYCPITENGKVVRFELVWER